MKATIILTTLLTLSLISCKFSKSVDMDLITGLTTKGDGLTCDEVYISDGDQKLKRNTFTYGETFYLNFENIEGFNKSEGPAFPGMQLFVIDVAGDTVMRQNDMYADYTEGVDISPLLLNTNLTVADPIHSNNEYTLKINIWDKKGNGTFKAILDFKVIPNDQIKIESNGISYDEIYLFSSSRNTTLTENEARFNEDIYMLFEGLEGFKSENGLVYPGLSIKVSAADGELILIEEDLIGKAGMDSSDFRSQIAPNFIIKDTEVKTPVICEILIWDKKSENSIKVTISLNLNQVPVAANINRKFHKQGMGLS